MTSSMFSMVTSPKMVRFWPSYSSSLDKAVTTLLIWSDLRFSSLMRI
jgi:hypothetical protein